MKNIQLCGLIGLYIIIITTVISFFILCLNNKRWSQLPVELTFSFPHLYFSLYYMLYLLKYLI